MVLLTNVYMRGQLFCTTSVLYTSIFTVSSFPKLLVLWDISMVRDDEGRLLQCCRTTGRHGTSTMVHPTQLGKVPSRAPLISGDYGLRYAEKQDPETFQNDSEEQAFILNVMNESAPDAVDHAIFLSSGLGPTQEICQMDEIRGMIACYLCCLLL